jgi:hypothetical protein
LRESRPDVFERVRQHIDALRRTGAIDDEYKKAAADAWQRDLEALALDTQTKAAVLELIKSIFGEERDLKPQGLAHKRHADYWQRFLTLPDLSSNERDQPVLEAMKAGDDDRLLEMLDDYRRAEIVYDFADRIDSHRLRGLLVPLLQRHFHEDPATWADNIPPGLIPLWRMWLRRSEKSQLESADALKELHKAMDLIIPTNLAMAAELEHHFVVASKGVHDILSSSDQATAKAHLRHLLATRCNGQPEALASGLRGAKTPTLLWLTWGLDRVRAKDMLSAEPFPGWAGFASVILAASKLRPRDVLPQFACLVANESVVISNKSDNLSHQYEFDEKAAERLFGSKDVVLQAFENESSEAWQDEPHVLAVVLAALANRRRSAIEAPAD